MFYKLFFNTVLILAIVLTIILCAIKPQMHTTLMVYDSGYKIIQTEPVTVERKTEQSTPAVMPQQEKSTKIETIQITEPRKADVHNTITKTVEKAIPQTNTNVTPIKTKIEPKVVTEQKQIQVLSETKTSLQEEIEWNKWRSNIQNQIMKDVKLPILPQGTVFKFSFDVDKYGKVTNVQTWSMTPTYTPYAIQHIAPVIRSYQGHSILDFPSGSNRFNTTVTGQWKISNNEKYSTSSNFHDIETLKKEF